MTTAFEVTYQGRTKSLTEWAKGKSIREFSGVSSAERVNFRDLVNTVAGICLGTCSRIRRRSIRSSRCSLPEIGRRLHRMPCADRGPEPHQTGGRGARRAGAARRRATRPLPIEIRQLHPGDRQEEGSGPGGQPLRADPGRLQCRVPGPSDAAARTRVDGGRARGAGLRRRAGLGHPGQEVRRYGLLLLAGTGVDELAQFKHIERPKDWNLPALKALFELVGLTPGMGQLVTQGKDEDRSSSCSKPSPWWREAGAGAAEPAERAVLLGPQPVGRG